MAESQDRPLRVFICHSSADKPTVRDLCRQLSTEGWIDVWLDEEKLLPGQDWENEIERALDNSDAVIVTLSTGSVSKEGYVQKELRFVLEIALEKPEGTIFLLPLRLDDCERPRRIRSIQGVDYFPAEHREQAYIRLRRSLELRANSLGIVTVKPEPITEASAPDVEKLVTPAKTIPSVHKIYTFSGIEFVKIPAGKFIMGSRLVRWPLRLDMARGNEKPQHTVDIPYVYYMGRFPVTNEQYATYVKAKDIKHPVNGWEHKRDHPVVSVSWDDAMEYCQWLNQFLDGELSSGLVLRLPTEAEWEKAARGPEGFIYPWGDSFDKGRCNVVPFIGKEGVDGETTPVGSYSPLDYSTYGCADMAGNVFEWTHSLDKPYPYKVNDGREDEAASSNRIIRGGSYYYDYLYARCGFRVATIPTLLGPWIGFRVVLAPRLP